MAKAIARLWLLRLAVRTAASHAVNTGSIPVGVTKISAFFVRREQKRTHLGGTKLRRFCSHLPRQRNIFQISAFFVGREQKRTHLGGLNSVVFAHIRLDNGIFFKFPLSSACDTGVADKHTLFVLEKIASFRGHVYDL